jgi:SAM-dependent methyltransferase
MEPLTDAEVAALPWPGDELVLRVAGGDDKKSFFESGRQSVRDIEAVLSGIGRTMDSYETILDFGSGCGRIMLWLEKLSASSSLHGVDIDKRAVEYSQRTFPYASFKVNQPLPPLDYPDGTFDLVYNHSVFTHIDEEYQDAWLAELHRVTKPGGHLVLSIHGEEALRQFELHSGQSEGPPSSVRKELAQRGICFIKEDSWVGGPFPDFYHSTFHAPWYIFEHWGRVFDIRAFVARGSLNFQDFLLLERPADDAVRRPISIADIRAAAGSTGDRPPLSAPVTAPAHAVLQADVDVTTRTRYATAARLARRLALRATRHYRDYQREVDRRILESVDTLQAEVQTTTSSQAANFTEMYTRLWHAVNRQGERINRLETDLWEAIRSRDQQPGGPS